MNKSRLAMLSNALRERNPAIEGWGLGLCVIGFATTVPTLRRLGLKSRFPAGDNPSDPWLGPIELYGVNTWSHYKAVYAFFQLTEGEQLTYGYQIFPVAGFYSGRDIADRIDAILEQEAKGDELFEAEMRLQGLAVVNGEGR